jgi:hypothetical protein
MKSISHAIQLNPFLTSYKDDIIIILRRNWVSLSPINVLRLESVGVVCACMQGRDVKKTVGISLFLGPGSIVKCIILFWKNWANYINPYIEVVLTLKLNLMLEQGRNQKFLFGGSFYPTLTQQYHFFFGINVKFFRAS